jgi:hypothetical protein
MTKTILTVLVAALSLVGCATTPMVPETRKIHFTKVQGWAQDLQILSIKGVRHGDDVDFSVEYQSGIERQFSFFDPPDGASLKYTVSGIVAGEGTLTFSIAVIDLKLMQEATMGFGFVGDDRNFISLNMYDIRRLIK